MTRDYSEQLDALTRLRGVRGAMVVSGADGVVVAESLMEGVKGRALAALTASLAARVAQLGGDAGGGTLRSFQLQASDGTLFAAPGGAGLLLVVLAEDAAPVGMVRVEMLQVAGRLS